MIKTTTQKDITDLGIKVRAIMGVPEKLLPDEIIASPVFISKSKKYITSYLKDYDIDSLDKNMINIAQIYYICYLLCPGMFARVPKQMENTSTKTILQSMDWNEIASDMISKCNDMLDDIISEIDDSISFGTSFAVLTDASEYPNTTV